MTLAVATRGEHRGLHFSLSVYPKIESKSESTLDFGHRFIRQFAKPALQSRLRQRTQSLHIGHGLTVEKPEPGQRYFVRALSVLGGRRYV